VLENVITKQGPSSETYGILGRVYKDKWTDAKQNNHISEAEAYLDKAISTYIKGFEADFRDAYPGINAVTLLDIKGDNYSLEQKNLYLPIVKFAVLQRLKGMKPDYWDYATLLELSVLEDNHQEAQSMLSKALIHIREIFEPKTSANNLRLIRDARLQRGMDTTWLEQIVGELEARAEEE